jgi:trk system potassium uptake protein TrkA
VDCFTAPPGGRARPPPTAGLRSVRGDPTVPATLEAAGALRADVLIAGTTSDETNLVVSLLAKKHFSIPRVIGRVNDAANEDLFGQAWGVDALVSPSTAIVSMVRQQP